MQTPLTSFIEALLNVGSGFIISFITATIAFPLFGFNSTPSQNFYLVTIFTIISIIRSYIWRRLFNHFARHSIQGS